MVGVCTDDKLWNKFVCAPEANVPKVSHPIESCENTQQKTTQNIKWERNSFAQFHFAITLLSASTATLGFVITLFQH